MPIAVDGMKLCPGCGETLPVSEFWKNRNHRDGLQNRCKPCHAAASNAPLLGPNRERYLRYRKDGHLRRTYGVSIDEYEEMASGGCCICGQPQGDDAGGRKLAVDHDHSCCPGTTSCGKCVRGVLCRGCNIGLSNFKDDPELLRRAADYLS